jgi:hypothetical protein
VSETPAVTNASWSRGTVAIASVLFLLVLLITNEYHPYVEIRIAGLPLPKKIEFKVQIVTRLKGINLKIKAGTITEIQAGSCDFEGKVKYQDLTIVEKKLGPIELLGVSTIAKQEASPIK